MSTIVDYLLPCLVSFALTYGMLYFVSTGRPRQR